MVSADLFEYGTVGRTLAALLATDAAWLLAGGAQAQGDAILAVFTDEPLLAAAIDHDLVQLLFDHAHNLVDRGAAERGIALAEVAAQLITPTPPWARVREAGLHLYAQRPDRALTIVDDLPKEVIDTANVLEIAARSHAGLDRHEVAIPLFLRGAQLAHAEGSAAAEWDLLTNAVASQMALGDLVASLSLAGERIEPIAIELGDAWRLSKTYGDIGNARMGLRMYDAAATAYAKALQAAQEAGREQDESDWLGNLGSLAMIAGDFDGAIERHSAAMELSRRTGSARSLMIDLGNLASACTAAGRWGEALAHRQEAVAVAEADGDPDAIRAQRIRLRDFHLAMGHWRKAVVVDTATEIVPPVRSAPAVRRPAAPEEDVGDEDRDLAAEVEALVADGDLNRARERVEAYLRDHPDSAVAYFELGLVHNEAGDFPASLAAYDQALARKPRWPNLHRNALNSWRGLGDLETPRERYEAAVADDPFDALPRMVLALLYGMQGRHEAAGQQGREAVRLDPDNVPVRITVCKVVAEAAVNIVGVDWQRAWTLFEELMADSRAVAAMDEAAAPGVLTQLGEYSIRMAVQSGMANPTLLGGLIGDREAWLLGAAVSAFASAIELNPSRRRPRAGLAEALRLMDVTSERDAWLAYAQGLADSGAIDLAIAALERAVDDHPDDPQLLYELGMMWMRSPDDPSGGLVRAKHLFAAAAEMDPTDGRYPAAYSHATALIEARP